MRTSRLLIALLLALPLAAARLAAQQPAADALRLRPGDALRVMVKDEPALSGEFPVAETGSVLLPEVGLMPVTGRPFEVVERELREAYAKRLVEPVISVTPLVRIAVLGEVRKPGLFPVDPTQTLGDVLASAGGLTPSGNGNRITLVRDGHRRGLRLDPGEAALKGTLLSGDQIIVAKQGWLRENLPVLVGAGASVLAAAVTSLIVR
ncbi:MAG TPA: polysaccharide biosynthesis/export family protein [Longimicrobiales bacterium]|nr:polysaccharide biosynthesis/export family protein [Longimicrobiales bacterium]